jgi:hypothetical protein
VLIALQLFEAVEGSSCLHSTTYTMLMGDNGRCVPACYIQQPAEHCCCQSKACHSGLADSKLPQGAHCSAYEEVQHVERICCLPKALNCLHAFRLLTQCMMEHLSPQHGISIFP